MKPTSKTQPTCSENLTDTAAHHMCSYQPKPVSAYIRDMSIGTRFRDTRGDIWQRRGEHGSHSDVWLATRERDGHESCFGGCAYLVVIGGQS